MKKLLMGNEAAAIAAIYAGVRVVCGYPGTPSTETLETVAKNNEDKNIYVEWSVNEKAALEVGAGAAYAGARTMVTMKQVGLNACADPIMSLAYIGVKGGMVIYVADDPGPISSQTEQDTRRFGLYSKLPVLDPTSPEELFDMIGYAFDLSEKIKKPVIVRPTTRICHACASVDIPDVMKSYGDPEGFVRGKEWVIFPRLSYGAHIKLEEISESLKDTFSSCQFNSVKNKGKNIAVVASGAAYPVANELISIYAPNTTLIKLGAAVPFPEKFLLDSLVGVEKVLVAEELDAVIEDALYILKAKYNLTIEIHGKRDGVMPHAGEYTAQSILAPVCDFLGATPKELPTPPALPVRPPVLCAGCPHRASFYAVKRAMKGKKAVFSGDIGCYTLGNAMPLDMVDTCLCMGAGVTIAQGLAHVESDVKHFAFIGDSTFFHSGITGIVNAVYNNADVNIIILDNSTTAMTGHQPHPGTGVTMMKEQTVRASIENICSALGVKSLNIVDPFDFYKSVETVKKAADEAGVSVIIFRSPCIVKEKSTKKPLRVSDKCTGCQRCIREIGCPAMKLEQGKVHIDPVICTGCSLCTNLCAFDAIGGND